MVTLGKGRKIGAVGCERARALSLSLATVWQPLRKERKMGAFTTSPTRLIYFCDENIFLVLTPFLTPFLTSDPAPENGVFMATP